MSTVCQCNKVKKRNTHLGVKEASWNIAPLLSYLRNTEIPPPPLRRLIWPAWFGVLATQFGVFSTCESRQIQAQCGGGVAWVALWRAFPQTQELVFWLFLRGYFTSGPFSCWYFLLIKQRFFWYYSSRQVMAIFCCVVQKEASAAQQACSAKSRRSWSIKKIISKNL